VPEKRTTNGYRNKNGIATLDGSRGIIGTNVGWREWCVEKGKNVGKIE
jgi:hypothetical protein